MKKIDYTNRIFGKLTVKEFDNQQGKWKCECECGNIRYYSSRDFQINKPLSCGCLRSEDLTGRTYGRLYVKERTDQRDSNYNVYYLCECLCKETDRNTKLITAHALRNGYVKSCGCLPQEVRSKTGKIIGSKTREMCVDNTNIRNLTMKTAKNNTSGIRGVSYDIARHKWLAQITFRKKNYHLGRYNTKEDAARIRNIAEKKLFGEFLEWYNENFKPRN